MNELPISLNEKLVITMQII